MRIEEAFRRLVAAATGSRLDDLAILRNLPPREPSEGDASFRRRMTEGTWDSGPRALRCSFCGAADWQTGRMLAGSASAFICDACTDAAYEVLHETPVPAPAGEPPHDRSEPLRIDWASLPHHQTHGRRG